MRTLLERFIIFILKIEHNEYFEETIIVLNEHLAHIRGFMYEYFKTSLKADDSIQIDKRKTPSGSEILNSTEMYCFEQ